MRVALELLWLCQGRKTLFERVGEFEQIQFRAIGRDVEDRRIGIGVDRNDLADVLDPLQVLNCAGNAECYV